ncbi:MAG: hypothetical protein N2442_09580 [Spirochaetes bacterium]|nr:hypothetical protein [Spirochaetota bacterium]
MKGKNAFQAVPLFKGAAFFFRIALLLVSILLFSCSGRYPRIHDVRYRIIILQGPNDTTPQETLSLALDITDEDGIEDLEAVALVQDAEELYWKIRRDQWEWKPFAGGKWLVCSGLLSQPGRPFPRGGYRVVVTDLAGYRAEREFSLSAEPFRGTFPSIQKKGGMLVLYPGSGSTLLVLTSSTGSTLGSFPLKRGENSLQPILASPAIRTQVKEFFLYSKTSDGDGPIWVKGPYEGSKFFFSREETKDPVQEVQ